MSGRVRDLGLHLLDRQVLDTQQRAVGKVDDVELTVPEDGSPPYVSGPAAHGPRLGGLLGRWLVAAAEALGRSDAERLGRIGMELVTDIGTTITVSRSRRELGVHENEDRVREYLVERIPGAGHASK
jgi:sporulation protein YlmC with PRC-barrel domain